MHSPNLSRHHFPKGVAMSTAPPTGFSLVKFEPRTKALHLTWLAYFVSFIVWLNHAPLAAAIRTSLPWTHQDVSTRLIFNGALPIPTLMIVGMRVSKGGLCLRFADRPSSRAFSASFLRWSRVSRRWLSRAFGLRLSARALSSALG
jgi:hypothetical protein